MIHKYAILRLDTMKLTKVLTKDELQTMKYKKYRIRNKKGQVTDFQNGASRSEDKKNAFNKTKPFVPHWIEYRLVDEFKVKHDPSLKPDPLNDEKFPSLCCRCFSLPASPEEIRQAYMDHKRWTEIDKIAPMVIHIGEFAINPFFVGDTDQEMGNYYTCKHLKNGECTDYENRPKLCSSFTYKEEYCEHCTTKPHCNGVIDHPEDKEVVHENIR